MKTIFILIVLLTFSNLHAQDPTWHPKVQTYIPYVGDNNYTERVAIFTNHFGVHVLKSIHNGNLKHIEYFRLTTGGNRPTGFPVDGISLDTHGDFPCIMGDETIMYAVYRKDYTIQVQKSTNGGDNWSSITQINFVNGSATNCNGIDAAYTSEIGLHVVWSEKVSGNYESYFKLHNGTTWETTQPITNTSPVNNGGFPTITTSYYNGVHKAHVTINTGNSDIVDDNHGRNYSRYYDYENNWSAPLAILPQGQESQIDRLLFTEDGNLHSFYYKYTGAVPNYMYRKKLVTSSSWGSEKQIELGVDYNVMHKIQIAKTSGLIGTDMIHAFWMDFGPGFWQRYKNSLAEEWTSTRVNVSLGGVNFRDAAATSISNDLFAVWSQYGGAEVYEFRQYDDKPLHPQNLTISRSPNNHPYL